MCGIVAGYTERVRLGMYALRHRGPDAENVCQRDQLWFGHTRLAILDLHPRSNQPFVYGTVTLVYNGELWNYQTLRDELAAEGACFETTGDTEVVAAALDRWDIQALSKFNGMFALAWTRDGRTLTLARDRYGEIPLHMAVMVPFACASEVKALLALGALPQSIAMVSPGVVVHASTTGIQQQRYATESLRPRAVSRPEAATHLRQLLQDGCRLRRLAEVPVCTLLSGGIDSAAIAWGLVQASLQVVAYTAVHQARSADLRAARLVAQWLAIPLVEVAVPAPTAADLSQVIQHIEQPHKAQVEIGWACLCLARQMQADGYKVTFSGEGSDELWASYGFAYHALRTTDWHDYRYHLFLQQHRKNFARCNKIFMAHGIECRLPFLHPPLVAYALQLPRAVVQDSKRRPKAVLQDAFLGVLPPTITTRAKVAFQDGLGLKQTIADLLPFPERFYHAEYFRHFGAVATGEPRPSPRRQVAV